jgi:hypothetical protein
VRIGEDGSFFICMVVVEVVYDGGVVMVIVRDWEVRESVEVDEGDITPSV